MIGYSEQAKVTAIAKTFSDAYKSELSCVLVDGIERLLDWVQIGPRFSNAVLQTLIVCLRRNPPPGKKLIIIGTTNNRNILKEMDMIDSFNAEIPVNPVTSLEALDCIMGKLNLFQERERSRILQDLKGVPIRTGIKRVLMLCERARIDVDPVSKFISSFAGNSLPVTDRLQGLMNEMQDTYMQS